MAWGWRGREEEGPSGEEVLLGITRVEAPLGIEVSFWTYKLGRASGNPLRQKQAIEARTGYVENLVHNLQEGAEITSDYSGMDFPRECWNQIIRLFKTELAAKIEYVGQQQKGPFLHFKRSCDSDLLCQRVLKQYAHWDGPTGSCVFRELSETVDPEVLGCVKMMLTPVNENAIFGRTPTKKKDSISQTDRDRMAMRFQMVAAHLFEHRHDAHPPNARSYCLVHKKMCSTRYTPGSVRLKANFRPNT